MMQITVAAAAPSHWGRTSDQAPGVGIKQAKQNAVKNNPSSRESRRQLGFWAATTSDFTLFMFFFGMQQAKSPQKEKHRQKRPRPR
jgi:hypothetical protein